MNKSFADNDIAIIGMAGVFPGATDTDALFRLLGEGKDAVGPLPEARRKATALPEGPDYRLCGYLDNIDQFDHRFFNISLAEARAMDPRQRLLLQTVQHTLENAAYTKEYLAGKQVSVFAADDVLDYYRFAEEFDPTLITGNTKAYLASRLNNVFGWSGSSMNVDTTCSSSLVILQLACNELLLGQAEYALICGAFMNLFPVWPKAGLELDAPDGHSKAFSAAANGMSMGEAVGALLLKPLAQAMADQDIIHAVIKGYAVNSNANKAAGLTTPDSKAQEEVIRKAWQRSGVPMGKIGFLEAHGSGTQLGDHIEIAAIDMAFKDQVEAGRKIPVSSVKNNLGHCRSAAGMTSLIKTILSLSHKKLFPTVNFEQPSPLIDFGKSLTTVQTDYRHWEVPGGEQRYAGVSSVGLSGTNCHIVLAEAPLQEMENTRQQTTCLFTVSGRSVLSLRENMKALLGFLHERPCNIADVSHTLLAGRDHHEYRYATSADTLPSLLQQLETAILQPAPQKSTAVNRFIFLFTAVDDIPVSLVQELREQYLVFRTRYDACISAGNIFAFQYAFYYLLKEKGIHTPDLLGTGDGKILVDLISGDLPLSAALSQTGNAAVMPLPELQQRVQRLVEREKVHNNVVFLAFGKGGTLVEELRSQGNTTGINVIELPVTEDGNILVNLGSALYVHGVPVDWQLFTKGHGRRISLPGYRFDMVRCWLRDTPLSPEAFEGSPVPLQIAGREEEVLLTIETEDTVLLRLAGVWNSILGTAPYSPEDNFFDVGGDSLKASRVILEINRIFSIKTDFEDIFDFPVLHAFAAFITSQVKEENILTSLWKEVLLTAHINENDNFFELGGHSLMANQIIHKIQQHLHIKINFEDFFISPTIRLQAELLRSRKALPQQDTEEIIVPLPPSGDYAVSHAQKRMWIVSRTESGSIGYNNVTMRDWDQPLDLLMLEKALATIIQRHESLRTVFITKNGEPRQQVLETISVPLSYHDIRNAEDMEGTLLHWGKKVAATYLDLEKGPLFHVTVLQTGDEMYRVFLCIHHIISDGWSMTVFVREMLEYYTLLTAGKTIRTTPLQIQYKDFSAWHNMQLSGARLAGSSSFWKDLLGNKDLQLALPYDNARPPILTHNGAFLRFLLDGTVAEKMDVLARSTGSTYFMTWLTLFKVFIHKITGSTLIVTGTPLSGRDNAMLQEQIGFYVNMLPLLDEIDPALTFTGMLEIVKKNVLAAFRHKNYPFDRIVSDLGGKRDMSRNPVFDIAMTVDQFEYYMEEEEADFLQPGKRASHLDLRFMFLPYKGKIMVEILYNEDLFRRETISLMQHRFTELAGQVAEDPLRCIADYTLETEIERNKGKAAAITIDFRF